MKRGKEGRREGGKRLRETQGRSCADAQLRRDRGVGKRYVFCARACTHACARARTHTHTFEARDMDSHAQHALGVANARPPAVCACVSARARLHLFAKANFHARWQGRDSEIGETARATGRERERERAGMRVGEREWEGGGEI